MNPPPRTAVALGVASLAACATLVAGCGSSSGGAATTSSRAATPSCREIVGATRMQVVVRNALAVPVRLENSGIDCTEWSGTHTPAQLNQTIAPGATARAALRLKASHVQWTMVPVADAAMLLPSLVRVKDTVMQVASSGGGGFAPITEIGDLDNGHPVTMEALAARDGGAYEIVIAEAGATRQASASAGLIRQCPGTGANWAPFRLNLENRLDMPVSLAFSQVECSDWTGRSPMSRTPAFYSPVNLEAGSAMPDGVAGATIAIDPAYRLGDRPWLTTLQATGGKVIARFRTGLASLSTEDASGYAVGFVTSARTVDPQAMVVLPADPLGGRAGVVRVRGSNTLVVEYAK